MTRVPDWMAQLTAVVVKHDALPFAWGPSDCLSFPADAAEAITGISLKRPVYRSERGASRSLRRMGAADPHEAMAKHFEEIPPAFAGTGDLAGVINEDGRPSGGVLIGAIVYVKAQHGLARLPRTRIIRAFKV
ncbi:DUF6950 family protein [Xanthobacteraceae bacterium A53D]